MPPRKKTVTLAEFAKTTRRPHSGPRAQLDDNPTAAEDTIAFAEMKASGAATASWRQYSVWMAQTHGISMRPHSIYAWLQSKGITNGRK